MSRASNDLADIVSAIPAGEGSGPCADHREASMLLYYPAQYQSNCVYAVCRDAAGKPLEGVGVRFSWKPEGEESTVAYTNSSGVAPVAQRRPGTSDAEDADRLSGIR